MDWLTLLGEAAILRNLGRFAVDEHIQRIWPRNLASLRDAGKGGGPPRVETRGYESFLANARGNLIITGC